MIRINQRNSVAAVALVCGLLLLASSGEGGFFSKAGKKTASSVVHNVAAPKPTPAAVSPAAAVVAPIAVAKIPSIQKPISSARATPEQVAKFDFSTKKDPFKPYVVKPVVSSSDMEKQKKIKDQLPIHRFDVSQFRLTGVVADPNGNKAMIVDPDRKAYVIKIGMTIGKNEGKVTQISTAGVDVVEQFQDDNNKIRKETIRIPLLRKP